MADVSNWEIITSVGTLLGGAGAAVGAWYARDAARASQKVAEQTRTSAGLVMKPTLSLAVVAGGLAVRNESRFDATEVEVTTTDGRAIGGTPLLKGVGYIAGVDQPPGEIPLSALDGSTAEVRLRYADARRYLFWATRFAVGWNDDLDSWWVERIDDGQV